ncbi:MAG: deoxyribonuclease IV [Thermoguttaceae bacterium]|jgi:deoxyribonuclease-4
MPLFGVHESIAEGFDQAVRKVKRNGFDTLQIFSKNSNRWTAKPITSEAAKNFRVALHETGCHSPIIHVSYLINAASPNEELRAKSVKAIIDELNRADVLGVRGVVMHPGAFTTGTEASGLRLVAESLDLAFQEAAPSAQIFLETTAGQGTSLGSRFEHLAEIIGLCNFPDRLAVCFDTCHVFAAGYEFDTREKYEKMMAEFDRIIGLNRLKALHLNDSVKERASRVDRHAAIGRGMIGLDAFRFIVNDRRFVELPMVLETPKGTVEVDGETVEWDVVNLRTLRGLMGD